jgi:hypothetical protein
MQNFRWQVPQGPSARLAHGPKLDTVVWLLRFSVLRETPTASAKNIHFQKAKVLQRIDTGFVHAEHRISVNAVAFVQPTFDSARRRVTKALKSWRTTYDDLHSASNRDPILSYQDGGTFLIIRERRLAADDMTHRLRGSSRRIYFFCEKNRSLSEIVERFAGFGQEKILPFLNMMVDKKLMFREGERFLSLAVPIRGFTRKSEIRISKSEMVRQAHHPEPRRRANTKLK